MDGARMLMRTKPIAAGVIAALFTVPAASWAQQPPPPAGGRIFGVQQDAPAPPPAPPREVVRLQYVAPPGCPDERGLRDTLAARLGYDPVDPAAPRLVRLAITRDARGFAARADLLDPAGRAIWSRPPLVDADCRALVDVMGLSLKFAIDPDSTAAQPAAPSPAPIVVLPPPPPAPVPAAPRPEVTPSETPRPRVRLGVRGAAAVATAPSPTGTVAADVGVGWTHFSIALEGRFDVPVTGAVDDGVQARSLIAAGSLVPCGHYGWFAGCAVFSSSRPGRCGSEA